MTRLHDGSFLKHQLSSFIAVVFQHAVILLLLTHSCRGQSQGVGPSQTVVTLVGEDVVLPCHLEPALDAVSQSVEWGRPDLEPRFIHVWHRGQNHLVNQNPSYKGRTSMSVEKLTHGDLSLTLSAVKISDNGLYRCYFPPQDKKSTVELVAGSVSSPVVTQININSSDVVLQCESEGWYPEPEVLWLDGEGNLLPAGRTETVRRPDDLYTVSSRVTVERRHRSSFTCRVQQMNINQTREAHIQVTADSFSATCCLPPRISIIVAVGLIFFLAAACFVCKWRQSQIKDTKNRRAEADEREREQLLAKTEKKEDLKEKKAILEEILQVNKEEEKNVEEAVEMLMEHSKELQTQTKQLEGQKNEKEKNMTETEKKIQSVERTAENSTAQGYTDVKEIILTLKKQLNDTKQEDENLKLKTQKLQMKTDSLINKMTNRKKEVENQREKINEQLEEINRKLQSEQKQET